MPFHLLQRNFNMLQPLIQYPDPKIRLISANVRFFNEELQQWIVDMRDTMIEHQLEALSAILIGIQYNVILLKEEEKYIPYINARIIKHNDLIRKTERSIYYPGISADIERYESISVVYENECGEAKTTLFDGEVARIFQQCLDYSFGSTFVDRCDSEMKQRINSYLEYGFIPDAYGGSCPTVFIRDYFKKGAKYLMAGIALTFIAPFIVSPEWRQMIYMLDKIALALVPVLMVIYFMYAQYEAKIYKQCTSCQIGNIIGTTAIMAFQLLIVALGVFFWVAPQ